ncbi:MAG: ASPIC/UnbV domain-containing protein [Bacteroidetes bacterium]|nr:ASPIC/UnbV domain-containing protein [Bacteroidota bacterium]
MNFYVDTLDVASPYDSLLKYDLHGCSFGDMDNDGFQDLYTITGQDFNELDETVKNILFKNNAGSFDFKNKIGDYVLENGKNRGRNVLWLDWDKNGFLDLLTFNEKKSGTSGNSSLFSQESNGVFVDKTSLIQYKDPFMTNGALYRNSFKKTNELIGIAPASTTLFTYNIENLPFVLNQEFNLPQMRDYTVNDFNNDGRMDLFVSKGPEPTEVFQVNDSTVKASLRLKTEEVSFFLTTDGDLKMFFDFIPYTGTNKFDIIYIGKTGYHPTSFLLELSKDSLKNIGTKNHTPIFDEGLYIGYDTIKKWWKITGSATKLGEVPLYITTSKPITNIKREGFNESKKLEEVSLLLQNGTGVFVDNGINLSNTTNAFAAFSVVSGDFDNDMDIDIYLNASTTVQNLPNTYFQNQGNGIFVVDATGAGAGGDDVGHGGSVSAVDFNNDGFLDLLCENGEGQGFLSLGELELFKNKTNGNHWVQMDLIGQLSNKDAVGAYIECFTNGVKQVRLLGSEIHRYSKNSSRIHFGLGANTNIDSLKIYWPSGIVQLIKNIEVDKIYKIDEQAGIVSGINNIKGQKELVVYPNPTRNKLLIEALDEAYFNGTIMIYDMRGSLVKSIENTPYSKIIEISINDLLPGNYILLSNQQTGVRFIKVE